MQCEEEQLNEIEALKAIYPELFESDERSGTKAFYLTVKSREETTNCHVVLHVQFPPSYPTTEPAIVNFKSKDVPQSLNSKIANLILNEVSKLGESVIYNLVEKISDMLDEAQDLVHSEKQESLYDEMTKMKGLRGAITTDHITYDKCGTLSELPLDILLYIFSFSDVSTLSRISLSCRQINYFVEHSRLWHILCTSIFPHTIENELPWKQLLKEQLQIENNFRYGKYSGKELKTMSNAPAQAFYLDFDSEVIVAASNNTIYFWTHESERAYLELRETVTALKLNAEFLLTVTDSGLILCDKYAGSALEVISTDSFVSCTMSNDFIAGKLKNNEIHIFEASTYQLVSIIPAVNSLVNRIVLDGQCLVYLDGKEFRSFDIVENEIIILFDTKNNNACDFDSRNGNVLWVCNDDYGFVLREGNSEVGRFNGQYTGGISYDEVLGVKPEEYHSIMWEVVNRRQHFQKTEILRRDFPLSYRYGSIQSLKVNGPYMLFSKGMGVVFLSFK